MTPRSCKDTISRITDRVVEEMQAWTSRPLERIYAAVVVDAINVKVRGHFPTEQDAMKCLYLVTPSLDPKCTDQTRWATRWKPALNAFAITFADQMPTKTN